MSTGYVDFPTLPAGAGSTSVPGLGTFGSFPGPRVVPIRDVPIADAPAVALG
jgi:hypothetical protein